MKKIFEIASEFLDYDVFAGERTNDIMARLKPALAEYKRLSETPITEDWLKEHGFVQNEFRGYEYDIYLNDREDEIRYYRRGGERDSTMFIYRNIGMEDEVCYELPEPYTVADLYDALELCGIKMEDLI